MLEAHANQFIDLMQFGRFRINTATKNNQLNAMISVRD